MELTLHSTAQQLLKFDRVAFHVFALSGQGSEALATFSPRTSHAWFEQHEVVQPWTERSVAVASLWRRALSRPEAISAHLRVVAPGTHWAEHQAGHLGNPSIDAGSLVWHVAMLGLPPAHPFDAVEAAECLAKLLAPLMGEFSLVEVPENGRMLQHVKLGMPMSSPNARRVRQLPDFASALHSGFEAVILSEGPRAPQGPTTGRL